MIATDILSSEHRVIERVIAVLEAGAARLEAGEAVRPGFFLDVADFVKGFADGCHHKKEEDVLFRAMLANGLPLQGGPVQVMLAEHEQGRQYIRGLRLAAEQLKQGDSSGRQAILQNAQGYAALLRDHIYKEDNILFPLANRAIPLDQQDLVAEGFERVEHEEKGAGVHEKYLALAEKLEAEAAGEANISQK
jgi:hemerythrin-like domain-containing protein